MGRKPTIVTPATPARVGTVGPLCPKCGDNPESRWLGPHYVVTKTEIKARRENPAVVHHEVIETPEHLSYVCPTCGYTRREPCKDAPPKEKA